MQVGGVKHSTAGAVVLFHFQTAGPDDRTPRRSGFPLRATPDI
jgi:hypothetical protein